MEHQKTKLLNKTVRFFYKLSMLSFWIGLPNFWVQDLTVSKKITGPFRLFYHALTVLIYGLIVSEWLALLTQDNLSLDQKGNFMVFLMAHPMLWSYCIHFSSKRDKVRKLLSDILKLHELYNDAAVERQMIKNTAFYALSFLLICLFSMVMFTVDAVALVIKKEGTFTTIITVWPMVDDNSVPANLCRVLTNCLWWMMMLRVLTVYVFVFSLTGFMSHQFKQLQTYFQSLNSIFENPRLSQCCREIEYEAAYKIGIKLHTDSLKCVNLSKDVCGWIFSGQIIVNLILLVILMSELVNADAMHALAIGLAACGILTGTGLFMCNAGDVTVEASHLCTAMYSSGWHNCQGHSSLRIRKLVMTSMIFAQRPVLIKGFGIIHLSYQSFVSLAKSTYSVFSLILNESNKNAV